MTKQPQELALLAESGRLLASVFGLLDRTSLAGMSTLQIDEMVEQFTSMISRPDQQARANMAMSLR